MATTKHRVLVVVPAFNEEEIVGATVREIKSTLPEFTCLVIDDGSIDETSSYARQAGAEVISLPYNLGVGGAMRVGFKFALAHDYDVVVQIDADGQHNPAEVHLLLQQLDNFDLAIGARFAGNGNYEAKGPRRFAMKILAWSMTRLSGVTLTDTTSGFRASGPTAVSLFAEHYPAEYLGDTVESLVIAVKAGLRVTQVPVKMRERAGGTPSQSPFKASVFLARVGLAICFALLRTPVQTKRVVGSK